MGVDDASDGVPLVEGGVGQARGPVDPLAKETPDAEAIHLGGHGWPWCSADDVQGGSGGLEAFQEGACAPDHVVVSRVGSITDRIRALTDQSTEPFLEIILITIGMPRRAAPFGDQGSEAFHLVDAGAAIERPDFPMGHGRATLRRLTSGRRKKLQPLPQHDLAPPGANER